MGNHIYSCNFCNIYTLKKKCSICGNECKKLIPQKYSVVDKYKSYRQIYMEYCNGKH